ncbi:MAG: energy-coupled thiamine transporter ThiT [Clostridia bacterium]|nr:energy-coupled thiamine transporter ThiT [Clostridia bacterium]
MKKSNTRKIAVSAMLIALGAVLSLIKIWTNPWGGSVTMLSMVPIVLISVMFGTPWGLFSSFVYALVQIGVDLAGMMGWGMDVRMWVGAIVFDYLLAYTAIGLAGVFRKKGAAGACVGTVIALCVRFVSHFISGYIFFDIWMPETFSNPAVYSVVYNGTYMLPELVSTAVVVVVLYKTNAIKRILNQIEK